MENLKLLNQEMITLGLMRETTTEDRRKLRFFGKELSSTEDRCYKIIYLNGIKPIKTNEIAQIFFPDSTINPKNTKNIWEIISRIKQKLGPEEIICRTGYGHISRRAMINNMVAKNK